MTQTVEKWLESVEMQLIEAGVYFGHGTDNAWDEAVQLVLFAIQMPLDSDEIVLKQTINSIQAATIQSLVTERIRTRKPLPYLTHQAWFAGMPFYVDERVLIPRSPFAEWIERQFSPWTPDAVKRIADVGTGSGCMAITAALYFENAAVDAIDVNKEALKIVEKNIKNYKLENRIQTILSDCFEKLPKKACYDIIMSNPPYVSQEEMQILPKEYTHEPRDALEASDKGLAVVERILWTAADYLTPNGILIIEVGNSREALIERYPNVPFIWLEMERGGEGLFLLTAKDLQHHRKVHAW